MIKLVDTRVDMEEDVMFGTCDLCSYISDHVTTHYIFENEIGARYEIETGSWSWGDYSEDLYVENVIDFACFLDSKEIKTFEELDSKIYEYYNEYQEIQWAKLDEN